MIYLNDWYNVFFSDKKREMTEKELEDYRTIQSYPAPLRAKMMVDMNYKKPEKNPYIIRTKGRALMEWGEIGFVPQFDEFFDHPEFPSNRLIMTPIDGIDFWMEYSKMLNKRRRR